MRNRLFVIGLAVLAHAGLVLGEPVQETPSPAPFPAPSSDLACALKTQGVPPDAALQRFKSKKGDRTQWDQIPRCGKKPADWSKLSCGQICRVTLNDLRPTQSAIGVEAVNCKANAISRKLEEKHYGDYFVSSKRVVPVIVGPSAKLYVTDHHHLSNALYRVDLPDDSLEGIESAEDWDKSPSRRELLVYVLFNLTPEYLQKTGAIQPDQSYDMDDFIASMNAYSGGADSDWCTKTADGEGVVLEGIGLNWPCNAQGKAISFAEIAYAGPGRERKIWELADDPYRSMARWVRNAYGYVKCGDDPNLSQVPACSVEVPTNPAFFMEFQWANFLRAQFMRERPEAHQVLTTTLRPGHGQLAAISRYLPDGMQMAEGSAARGMIGFNDGVIEQARPRDFPDFGLAQDECELEQSLQDLGAELGWTDSND